MKDFETFKSLLVKDGVSVSHKFNTRVHINDCVLSGDVLIIPHNVTVFKQTMPAGNIVEYALFEDADYQDLKRVYASWFTNPNSKGTMIDDLQETGDLNEFFAFNEGRKFQVKIIKDDTNLDSFGRPIKTYKFNWYKESKKSSYELTD